jgi:large subunit ribosomal protein L9
MQIILLEQIVNLGNLGDVVNVKAGYGRNFLIPQGKAKRATESNIAEFEIKRAELEKQQAALEKLSQPRAKELESLAVEITQKAGVDGKLFGSVTNTDIKELIDNAGHKVERSEIRMPEGPLKTVGEYEISIDLNHNQIVNVKVTVIGEET